MDGRRDWGTPNPRRGNRPAQRQRGPASLPQPLELRLRVGGLDEILRAGARRRLERLDRGRAVGAQQLPVADVELRLAALVGLAGRGQRRLRGACPRYNSTTA